MNTPTPTQTQGGESATPRTDDAQILASFNEVEPPHYPRAFLAVTADFARQLERETATLHAQIARLQQREGELVGALTGLRAACQSVLLPAINEAIKGGFKMETWTPEQMQWAKAVEQTEAALQSVAKEGEQ